MILASIEMGVFTDEKDWKFHLLIDSQSKPHKKLRLVEKYRLDVH